jgi:hypothetical protein
MDLNLSDRCDRCGARAYVRVIITVPEKSKDLTLKFCNTP